MSDNAAEATEYTSHRPVHFEIHAANPPAGNPVQGAVLTMGVADFDATAQAIESAGGTVALPKYALPGMAWQGYFLDTENNVFGIHQPDPEAK